MYQFSITALNSYFKRDLLIDCTGANKKFQCSTPIFRLWSEKRLGFAPIKDDRILEDVYGVNHDRYDPTQNYLVTSPQVVQQIAWLQL